MITSVFDSESNILETEFKNDVDAVDILLYLQEFEVNTFYPRKLKTLVTATDADFKFTIKDLKSFNQVKNQSLKQYELVVSAIIINNPVAAALSTVYSTLANNKKYKFKVFSTREAALVWLNSFGF